MLIGSTISGQYSAWLEAAGVGGDSPTRATTPTTPTTAALTNAGNATTTTRSTTTTTTIPATNFKLGEYDYIVVGSGAGGLIGELQVHLSWSNKN